MTQKSKLKGGFALAVDILPNERNKFQLGVNYKELSRSYSATNSREYCCIYNGDSWREKVTTPQKVYGRRVMSIDDWAVWANAGVQYDFIRKSYKNNLPDSYTDYYGFEDVSRVLKEINEHKEYKRMMGVFKLETRYKKWGLNFSYGRNLNRRMYLTPEVSGRRTYLSGTVREWNMGIFYALDLIN